MILRYKIKNTKLIIILLIHLVRYKIQNEKYSLNSPCKIQITKYKMNQKYSFNTPHKTQNEKNTPWKIQNTNHKNNQKYSFNSPYKTQNTTKKSSYTTHNAHNPSPTSHRTPKDTSQHLISQPPSPYLEHLLSLSQTVSQIRAFKSNMNSQGHLLYISITQNQTWADS